MYGKYLYQNKKMIKQKKFFDDNLKYIKKRVHYLKTKNGLGCIYKIKNIRLNKMYLYINIWRIQYLLSGNIYVIFFIINKKHIKI